MPAAKNSALKAVPTIDPITLDHPINSKITHDYVDVTPEVAEKWLQRNTNNRNPKKLAISSYARDMRNGRWRTTGEAIQFDWNGNMIDGQNRCHAVIDSGITIRALVVRGLAPETQFTIDQGAKRTAGDALGFTGLKGNLVLVAAAARIASARENGFLRTATSMSFPSMTHDETVEWVSENPDIHPAVALATRVRSGIGATPSVLAYCILELERIDGPAAVEFFTSMAEFRTEGVRDPRVTLLRTFNNLRERRVKATVALQISYIFRAWNAWRQNKHMTSLPATTSSVKGTVGVQIPEPR